MLLGGAKNIYTTRKVCFINIQLSISPHLASDIWTTANQLYLPSSGSPSCLCDPACKRVRVSARVLPVLVTACIAAGHITVAMAKCLQARRHCRVWVLRPGTLCLIARGSSPIHVEHEQGEQAPMPYPVSRWPFTLRSP